MTARTPLAALAGVLLVAVVTDQLDAAPEDMRLMHAQDWVVELETCRAVLDYVESWTGPEAPVEPLVLAAPTPEAYAAAGADYQQERPDFSGHYGDLLRRHVADGDRDGLVEFLTMEVGCAWMPVEPGAGGPSINEHARATYTASS